MCRDLKIYIFKLLHITKVLFTNLLCVLQEVNIDVPFHVKHDVKDQNHDNTPLVDLFEHNDYVNVQVHYYEVMFGIDGGLLLLHE